jgi:sulfite exporter TauE/SafE
VDPALFLSAVLMGLAGTPHCLAMCGAACTAASAGGKPRDLLPFHLGRLLAYAGAGAVAAASVGSLAALGQAVAALRPLWTMVHMAALALGLYLVWQGRQPAWMERLGRSRSTAVPHRPGERWQAVRGPARSAGLGLAWVAWPCGLLQSALLVASLANTAWSGAAVMAGFAGASAAGVVAPDGGQAARGNGRCIGGSGGLCGVVGDRGGALGRRGAGCRFGLGAGSWAVAATGGLVLQLTTPASAWRGQLELRQVRGPLHSPAQAGRW